MCGINSKAPSTESHVFFAFVWFGEGGRRVLFGVGREVDGTSELCIVFVSVRIDVANTDH